MEIAKLVSAWSADRINDLANRATECARAQIHKAVDELPAALEASPHAAAVDTWFVESFHQAPVSWDTELLNNLRAAAGDLKSRIAAAEAAH